MPKHIRLGTLDAAFLMAETRDTPVHVAGLHIFKVPRGAPPHYVSKLYAWMRGFPVTAEPFNYQVIRGLAGKLLPTWEVRDDIDLDYHLRFSALPHPGGERELGILVSRLHSIPMDLSRPLWEIHLIEGLANDRFALYYKLHHALVDGMTAVRLTTASRDSAGEFAPPVWAAKLGDEFAHRPPEQGLVERMSSMLGNELQAMPSLARGLADAAKAAVGKAEDPDLTSIAEAPHTLFNVRVGGQRRVATHSASLSALKAIGHAGGGTVNDAVLAACSGALRRYLMELDALPDKSLIANVPMALFQGQRDAAGNAVTSLMARLGTHEPDVRKRFEIIRRSSNAGKAHLKQMTETAALNYTMMFAAPVMLTTWMPGVVTRLPPLFNLIVSNVPGPRDKIHFHGAELETIYPVSQIGQGSALNITVMSYADQLNFGLVACRDTVPRVQRLAVYLGDAIEELDTTFCKPRSKRSPGRRKQPARGKRSAVKRKPGRR